MFASVFSLNLILRVKEEILDDRPCLRTAIALGMPIWIIDKEIFSLSDHK